MLELYGDESFKNTPGFQGCYALAGYLTDSDVWAAIDSAWEMVKNTPPSIRHFKMHEYWERCGEFSTLTKDEADAKYDLFIQVLEVFGKHMVWIDSVITFDCFNAVVKDKPRALNAVKEPYTFCLVGVFGLVTRALRATIGDSEPLPTVDFTFDEKQGVDRHILEAHQFLKENGDQWPIVNRLSFDDDMKCNPLQCADLLASHVRRNYVRPAEDKGRPLPGYSRLESAAYRKWSGIWKEEGLKDWIDRFEALG